jgi:hypothetical protein
MTGTRITPQDFQPAQRPKRKRGQLAKYSGTSTSFLSPNQFSVLSDSEPEEEEDTRQQDQNPTDSNIQLSRQPFSYSQTGK